MATRRPHRAGTGESPPPDGGVLVVGSVNVDLVTRVPDFPRPGETLLGSDYETHHGGKGANQAVAAARMGARVRFVGRVGNDAFGSRLKTALSDEGIDVSELQQVGGPSGAAFITLNAEGQNTIIVSPGANARLEPQALTAELFAQAAVVVLQLEIPPETVRRAIELASRAGALVVLNAAPAGGLILAELTGCNLLLVVNESEAAALLPGAERPGDPSATMAALAERVPRVVMTLGSQGVIWQIDGTSGRLPAFTVETLDTTAAGDAFVGALATGLATGQGWRRSIRTGSAAGALAVTRRGAQPSLPRLDEVTRLLADSDVDAQDDA